MSDIGRACGHGVKWGEFCGECDRVWTEQVVFKGNESHIALADFYGVTTKEALIDAQARHIEKLQAKLPPLADTESRNYRE